LQVSFGDRGMVCRMASLSPQSIVLQLIICAQRFWSSWTIYCVLNTIHSSQFWKHLLILQIKLSLWGLSVRTEVN
jgi:hypothetical protein